MDSLKFSNFDKVQKTIIKVYAGIILAAICFFLLFRITGHGVPCMFYELTGYKCPGCGSTHMVLSLLHGDIRSAFLYHPIAFFAFPYWFVISIFAFVNRPEGIRTSRFLVGSLYATIGAYCVFCIIRNII